jgi:hypothetical protein
MSRVFVAEEKALGCKRVVKVFRPANSEAPHWRACPRPATFNDSFPVQQHSH